MKKLSKKVTRSRGNNDNFPNCAEAIKMNGNIRSPINLSGKGFDHDHIVPLEDSVMLNVPRLRQR